MATYYFSSSGNDSNAGTESSPFLTIAKANTLLGSATAGDTFLFKGGETFSASAAPLTLASRNGTSSAAIKISSYGTGRATITFPKSAHGVSVTSCSYITFQNINIASDNTGVLNTTKAVMFVTGCTNIILEYAKLTGSTYGVQLVNTQFETNYVDVVNPYGVGINVSGTSNATINNVSAYQVGYTVSGGSYAANTVGTIELAAIRVVDTSYAVVRNAHITACQMGIFTNSTATNKLRIYRSFIDQSITGQRYGVFSGTPLSGVTQPLVLRDSIIRLSGSHLVQAVFRNGKGQVDVTNCTIVSVNTNGSSTVFDNQPIAATPYTKFTTKNCSVVINPIAIAPTAQANHYFVNEAASVNASARYEGITNNFAYVQKTSSPLTTPFKIGASSYTVAQWVTSISGSPSPLRETNSLQYNVIYQLSPGAVNPNIALLAPGSQSPTQYNTSVSPLVNAGTDLQSTYTTEVEPALDYFGTNRYPGYSGYWSIGAYENTDRPSVQLFNEGTYSGVAAASLESPANVESVACLLSTSALSNFPKVSHYFEAKVRFSGDVTRVGIYVLGGQLKPAEITTTPSFDIYQYQFQLASPVLNLTSSGSWATGKTPGYSDTRGVKFMIERDPTSLAKIATLESTSFSSSAPLTGVLIPADNVDHTLRIQADYVSTSSAGHEYKFSCYLNGSIVFDGITRVFSDSYITGVGYANASGPAAFCGIIGKRASTQTAIYWKTVRGRITGTTGGEITTAPVSARYKEFMSGRESALNMISNGGFTSYPIPLEPVIQYRSVILPPTGQLLFDEPVVNIVFMVPVRTAMGTTAGSGATYNQLAQRVLHSFLDNAPRDGSVQVTILGHAEDGDDGIGPDNEVAANNEQLTSANYNRIYADVQTKIVPRATANDRSAHLTAFGGPSNMITTQVGGVGTLPNVCVVKSFRNSPAGTKKIVVIIDRDEIYPNIDPSEPQPSPLSRMRDELAAEFPDLKHIMVVSLSTSRNAPTTAAHFHPILYPPISQTGGYTNTNRPEGAEYNDAVIPTGEKAIVIPLAFHAASPVTANPQASLTSAADQTGLDIATLVRRYVNQDNPVSVSTVQVPIKVLSKIPGRSASILISADKPAESDLGSWFVYGCSGSVDINPTSDAGQLFAYDGGNVAGISFAETGTIQLTQQIVDIKPLLGRWVTVAYSGHSIRGRASVNLILRVDGKDNLVDQIPSSSFGRRLRRAASFELPLNFSTLELVISSRGSRSDAFGISAVAMTIGRLEKDLPFTLGPDNIIPAGTVIMYSGSSCPPGYRTVPYSQDRLALLTASNPYELTTDRSVLTNLVAPEIRTVDLVLFVDMAGSMADARDAVDSWLNSVVDNLPVNESVFLSIVTSDGAQPGAIIVPRQLVSVTTRDTIRSAITNNIVNRLVPGSFSAQNTSAGTFMSTGLIYGYSGNSHLIALKSLVPGLTSVKTVLSSASSRSKLLFYMSDSSYVRTAQIQTLFSQITQIDGFREGTGALFPAAESISAAISHPEYMVFPLPVNNSPGELVDVTSSPGGVSQLGSFFAEKTINAVIRELNRPIDAAENVNLDKFDSLTLPPYLGGQKKHDHRSLSPLVSDINDSDGFEPASDETTTTQPLVPRQSTASISAYAYGSLNSDGRRSEDEPVLAIGVAHRHNFKSDMTALPPSFPVLFCEKL